MSDNNKSRGRWPLFCLAALFALFAVSSVAYNTGVPATPGQYPDVALKKQPYRPHSPVLKVVLPARLKESEGFNPYGPGMDHELLALFLERHDHKLKRLYADSYDEALRLLQRGSADLMLGFGCEAAFSAEKIARGPVMAEYYPVLVVLPDEELKGLDLRNVHFNKVAYSAAQLATLEEHQGRAALLDPASYALLMPMHASLRTAGSLAEKTGYYWFWNRTGKLAEKFEEFWADPLVGALTAELAERYYGFIPKEPRQRQLREINRVIGQSIGVYSRDIARAAAACDIDPILLSAVIFQESRFNPEARSYTGVRGIMQLTMSTADMLGVDRMDPSAAIMGGARYLRKIYNSLAFAEDMSEWDKWCLTLAGFNQGPTVMRRAVRAAMEDGRDLDWSSMRALYPELRGRGLAGAGFRSAEAVDYVENIRYFYYVLSGLARAGWPEHQNLAGLLASR